MSRQGIFVRPDDLARARVLEHLARAAAAIADNNTPGKADALLFCAMAMLEIAKLDPDETALGLAIEVVQAAQERTGAPESCENET